MKKLILPFLVLILFSLKSVSQCTDPVFSFFQDFSDPIFVTTTDPPACWTETEPLQTAYNTDAMRIFGAHNGDPQGMVVTRELFNVQGILTFKAKKGESFFNLPGDGMSVGVINSSGGFVDLFPFTYEATEATYTFDFSSYSGTGNRIAFVRTGTDKKVVSITDISYTSKCDPGVTAIAQDITISLDETGSITITPDQIDNGSMDFCNNPASLSIDVSTFTCDNLGANTVTLTAEDTFGTIQTASATVNVEPYIDVQVISDPIVIELDESGNATITESDLVSASETTCGTISLSFDQSTFTCAESGDVTVMITATHSTGPDEVFEKMISIVDSVAPVAMVNSTINLTLDASTFSAELTVPMVDNGSSDNCGIISQTLSKNSFSCTDIGENLITYVLEDAAGNSTEEIVTVNVSSIIVDETITTTASNEFCPTGSPNAGGVISVASSVIGIDYYLRDSQDNSIVEGPISGTGSGLDFNTGSIEGSKTFNVLGQAPPEPGFALDFDGVDDYVGIGTLPRDITKEVTVAAWVKTSLTGASNFIGGDYDFTNGVALFINSDGKARIDGRDGSTYKSSGVSTTLVNDGQWHLLVGTVNVNTGVWSIYVDGTLENSTTNAIGSSLASTRSFIIGGFDVNRFTGQIDQFALFNTALSDQEIADLNPDANETNLVGLYKFDEGSGTSLTDLSSIDGGGSLNNMDPSTDWVTGDLSTNPVCSFQMSTEITFGDGESPQIISQSLSVQLSANGTASVNPADADNGTTDNCTTSGNLIFNLSQSEFGCEDVGENAVTFSVTDEQGNTATSEITVTILSPISDQLPTAASTELCFNGSTTIDIPGSDEGIEYYLRKSGDNSIVEGPIAGTGGALAFNTGSLTETTDFNVLAKFGGGPGTSLDFDGSNDYIDTDFEIPVSSAMTIEAWIYPEGGLTNTILTNSIHAGTGSTNLENGEFWFNTASNSNGNGLTFTYIADNGQAATHARTGILTFNEWNHVAVVFNGSTGLAYMYINGVEMTTVNGTGASTSVGRLGSNLSIGNRHGGSGSKFFNGRVDEVRVWNTARTTQEILDNKDICLSGSESGLLVYYDFNEGIDGAINDRVASSSGTLTNFDTSIAWVDGAVGCVEVCEVQMGTDITVEINDTEPTALASDLTVQLDDTGNITVNPTAVDNGSSDDCTADEDLILSLSQSTFTCEDIGAHTVTFSVTDQAGLVSSTDITITVEDASGPTISAQSLTVKLDALGAGSIDASMVDTGTVDNCSTSITFNLSKTTFTCADLGENEVELTATDGNSNSTTETVIITVTDEAPPTALTLQSLDLELDENGNATLSPEDLNQGSSDNCTPDASLILSLSQSDFTCDHMGANSVIFTAEDGSGNTSTSTVTVNVLDNTAPIVIAQNIEARLNSDNTIRVSASEVDNGTSDNCGFTIEIERSSTASRISTETESTITFTDNDLGNNEVLLIATDDAGNSSSATVTITILEYKVEQTISFEPLSTKKYGDDAFDLTATASSGLSVAFSVVSGPASVSGNTLTIEGSGTVIVSANQAGNETYAAATSIEQSFDVLKANLVVTAESQTITYGEAIPAFTMSFSGFVNGENEENLDALPTVIADFEGQEEQVNAGMYDLIVSEGSADNYELERVNGVLTINKADQTIVVEPIDDKEPTMDPFEVVASVDSNLPLTYAIDGSASISETTVTLDGTEGLVRLTVSQSGDINHNESSVVEEFSVVIPLGFNDDFGLKIYPNPASNHLQIEGGSGTVVRIYSTDSKVSVESRIYNSMIDISALPPGIYFVEVFIDNKKVTRRFIKAN